jgi:hypothetical protein
MLAEDKKKKDVLVRLGEDALPMKQAISERRVMTGAQTGLIRPPPNSSSS